MKSPMFLPAFPLSLVIVAAAVIGIAILGFVIYKKPRWFIFVLINGFFNAIWVTFGPEAVKAMGYEPTLWTNAIAFVFIPIFAFGLATFLLLVWSGRKQRS